MTATLPAKPITDLVWNRLKTLTSVNWYRGEVPDHPPTLPSSDRVAPYGILYSFPGKPGSPDQADLGYTNVDLDWGGQITLAAGYTEDCEAAVDRVHELLFGWAPVLNGVAVGQLRPPVGFVPGTPAPDRSLLPPRFSISLQYRLTATAN